MPLRTAKLKLDTKDFDNKAAAAESRINKLQQETTAVIEKVNYGYQQSKIMVNALFSATSDFAFGQIGQIATGIGYTGIAMYRMGVEASIAMATPGGQALGAMMYGSMATMGLIQSQQIAMMITAQAQLKANEATRQSAMAQLTMMESFR